MWRLHFLRKQKLIWNHYTKRRLKKQYESEKGYRIFFMTFEPGSGTAPSAKIGPAFRPWPESPQRFRHILRRKAFGVSPVFSQISCRFTEDPSSPSLPQGQLQGHFTKCAEIVKGKRRFPGAPNCIPSVYGFVDPGVGKVPALRKGSVGATADVLALVVHHSAGAAVQVQGLNTAILRHFVGDFVYTTSQG